MKEKYVAEAYPPIAVFGRSDDGRVNVCDLAGRVDLLLPLSEAERLMAAYNRMQAQLVACALAFDAAAPEAFDAFWYGGSNCA